MSSAWTLAGIAAIHLLATMSPGPAFLCVTRAAVSQSRPAAVGTALGVATAAVIWALAATLGIDAVLKHYAWLYSLLRCLGGAYLVWLGIGMWRRAGQPLAPPATRRDGADMGRGWWSGFTGNLSNPKEIVFFGSIFVALFAPDTPMWVRAAALAIVAADECLWYILVVLALSRPRVRRSYNAAKAWIDRLTGSLMMLFGGRLLSGT